MLRAALLLLLVAASHVARADDAVVGTGTPASCTEAALEDALLLVHFGPGFEGGTVSFDCGPDPVQVPVTIAKLLTVNVIIDGGNRVDVVAFGSTRHFEVFAGRTELRNLILIDGRSGAGNYGGSVLIRAGAELVVDHCRFLGNEGGIAGGAIAGEPGSLLSVRDSTFDANRAASGGAIAKTGQLAISHSQFLSNLSSGEGGALQLLSAAGQIAHSTFVGNQAFHGGAIALRGGGTRFERVRLENNVAGGHGGGLYADDDAGLELIDTTIANNQAAGHGGGLHLQGVQNPITDPMNPGPIASGTSATITGSTISGNRANSGGGVFVFGPFLTGRYAVLGMQDSEVSGNTARFDGGGISSAGRLGLRRMRILDNIADGSNGGFNEGQGGGLYLASLVLPTPEQEAIVERSLIRGNRAASRGGGIYAFDERFVLQQVTLADNVARDGGGAYVFALDPTTLAQTAFVRNLARSGAGLRLEQEAPVRLEFLTFADNQVTDTAGSEGRDIHMSARSNGAGQRFEVSLLHVTALNTLGSPRTALYANDQRGFRLRHSIVFGGAIDCGSNTGAIPFVSEGGNLLRGPGCGTGATDLQPATLTALALGPLIEDGYDRYFLPSSTSPAVDFPLCAAGPSVDQRGRPLNQDGDGDGLLRCDAGAIERQSASEQPPSSTGTLLRDGFESP